MTTAKILKLLESTCRCLDL